MCKQTGDNDGHLEDLMIMAKRPIAASVVRHSIARHVTVEATTAAEKAVEEASLSLSVMRLHGWEQEGKVKSLHKPHEVCFG